MPTLRTLTGLASALVVLAPGRAAPQGAPLTPADSARHVLNRLGYGATPGEVDAVARRGVLRWVDDQLRYPDVDDPALQPIERQFAVLGLSITDMVRMQTAQQQQVRQLQAQNDSATRQQLAAQLRAQQQNGRKGLARMLADLGTVTMVRAVRSSHQFDEVLTDFWLNHFNVYINKGQDRSFYADYLEHTIRGHALGSFGELLLATARSPAMLFYLDNAESVAPGSDQRVEALQQLAARGRGAGRLGVRGRGRGRGVLVPSQRAGRNPGMSDSATLARVRQNMPKGINENYARELMELHTLGVDGGYTQQDVINVARVLTGWTIDRRTGRFVFRPITHDPGEKTVLGEDFPAGHGEDEGVRLLQMLADNPATMHHVSAELCQKFVADDPPDGCVDDAVHAWTVSHGNIRDIVRAIIRSPDFWAASNIDNKVKTPLEFVVSAVRAVGGVPDTTPRLAQQVGRLGEPLFQKQTPDGYGEREDDWVNSGALLARMNFAVALAAGRLPGVRVDLDTVVPLTSDHARLVDEVDRGVLAGAMSDHTRQAILKELGDVPDPRAARALAVGLALGGPEFQRQ
jgi:uncharacterized protein (DUF1800 family)